MGSWDFRGWEESGCWSFMHLVVVRTADVMLKDQNCVDLGKRTYGSELGDQLL